MFSWTLHSFPSIWKTTSVVLIHKMGKPLDSSASLRPISLTSCVSKLFERIILSRLLFFLESNSIISPRQAGFRFGQSTLDQFLYLSQSISNGLNKPRLGSHAILSIIDFSKACDSVLHPALFGWPPSLLCSLDSIFPFLIGALGLFMKIKKVPSFESLRCSARIRSWFCTFSLFINDLPVFLPSAVSCFLYADDLAIWSSSPSVPTVVEATQGALFQLERRSEYWCLPLNPSKCVASFFSVDSHQAHLQSNLLLNFTERLVTPSPAASRPSLFLFFSPRLLYLLYESP